MKTSEYEQIKAAIECMHSVEMHNGPAKGDFVSRQNVLYILSKFIEIQEVPPEHNPEQQAACSSIPDAV